MINIENIIKEYKDADAEKRLYLFLSYRSLRNEFMEIDQIESSVGFSAKPIKNKFRIWCANWSVALNKIK